MITSSSQLPAVGSMWKVMKDVVYAFTEDDVRSINLGQSIENPYVLRSDETFTILEVFKTSKEFEKSDIIDWIKVLTNSMNMVYFSDAEWLACTVGDEHNTKGPYLMEIT